MGRLQGRGLCGREAQQMPTRPPPGSKASLNDLIAGLRKVASRADGQLSNCLTLEITVAAYKPITTSGHETRRGSRSH